MKTSFKRLEAVELRLQLVEATEEKASVELSLSAVGCHGVMYTSISDALIRKLLLGAMPWCYDDPEDADQLERMFISVFGGCNIGNASKYGSTRVSPIATANTFIVDELASRDERLFIITL